MVYTTALTLIIFLLFRIPAIWEGVNFARGDAKSNGPAGGAAAIMLGLLVIITVILARVPFKSIWQAAPIILIMGALLFVLNLLTTPSTSTIVVASIPFGQQGFERGLEFFLRITIMVLASFIFIWTTDIRDLMTGLVRIGMPYRYAFAIFLALRFLPIVQQEVDAVKAAHAIRGRASNLRM